MEVWTSHMDSSPGPVSSSTRATMFCIYPRLNDDDGGTDADNCRGELNCLLGYWILISESDILSMCAWVCYGDLQQNSISCPHLSRLIILCSISFKQETSHFLGCCFQNSRSTWLGWFLQRHHLHSVRF